jgi:hypothetical protein
MEAFSVLCLKLLYEIKNKNKVEAIKEEIIVVVIIDNLFDDE